MPVDSKQKQISNKAIKRGIWATYARLLVYLVVSLLFPPYLLDMVGAADAGLYNYAVSFVSFILLVSFGIENSYVKFSMGARNQGDEALRRMNGVYLCLFAIIACLIAVLGISFSSLYMSGIMTVEEGDSYTVGVLVLIVSLFAAADFFMSIFSWHLYFKEKFVINQTFVLLGHVLGTGAAALCLFFGRGIYWVAICVYLGVFVMDLAFMVVALTKAKMRFIFPKPREFAIQAKKIWLFSIFVFITITVTTIYTQGGKLIIGNLYDVTVPLTVFTYGIQFYSYEVLFSQAVSNNFSPSISRAAVEGDEPRVHDLWLKASWAQALVLLCVVGGFMACGADFIIAWLVSAENSSLTAEDLQNIHYLGLGMLVLYVLPLSVSVANEVQKSYSKHRFMAVVSLVMALIGLTISAICVLYLPTELKVFGPLIGIGIGTIVSFVVGQFYYWQVLNLPVGKFYKQFLPILLVMAVSVLPSLLLSYFNVIDPSKLNIYVCVLIEGGLFLIIYLVLSFIIYRKRFSSFLTWKKKHQENKDGQDKPDGLE